ncbi:hypothetical protein niasHS_005959 [Heterodera schachtii]|uniref:Heat shock protein 70 n=1 Tax=Heterodera schachtii TaxID=97005 RepID=A0ABD2JN08_HETSC
MPKNTHAIGIDLGTSASRVGIFRNGYFASIHNDQGKRMMPSYVAFTDSGPLVGEAAKAQLATNPSNTVFDFFHLIGQKFVDPTVQSKLNRWPFRVVPGEDGRAKIAVQSNGTQQKFSVETILSMLLAKLKHSAEAFLCQTVADAVLTVPSHFAYSQRQAVKEAANIAGFNVKRLINAPTAASIEYAFNNNCQNELNVLIFDLGASNVGVTIVNCEDGIIEVKSCFGDSQHGYMLSWSPEAFFRVRAACENAKCTLSFCTEDRILRWLRFKSESDERN